MHIQLKKNPPAKAIPITIVDAASFEVLAGALPPATAAWLTTNGFTGAADSHVLVPDADGGLGQVFAGVSHVDDPFGLAALPTALPTPRLSFLAMVAASGLSCPSSSPSTLNMSPRPLTST